MPEMAQGRFAHRAEGRCRERSGVVVPRGVVGRDVERDVLGYFREIFRDRFDRLGRVQYAWYRQRGDFDVAELVSEDADQPIETARLWQ